MPDATPEPSNPQADLDALVASAQAAGLDCEDLDEHVHDVASRNASAVNNSGLAGQLEFLVNQLGADGVRSLLELP